MGNERTRTFLAIGVVIILIAAGAAIGAGSRKDISVALGIAGFGLAAIALGLMVRRPKARKGATRRGSVCIDGAEVPALEIPTSNAKTSLAVLGFLGFGEGGIVMIYTGRVWAGAFVAVGSGALALIGLRNLVIPPVVSLSERGVHWHSAAGHRWVPWDEVEYVSSGEFNGAPFVGVYASHGPRFEGRSLGRLFARAGKLGADINVPADAIGIDPEQLERMMEELAEEPESRPGIADRGAVATGPPGTARFGEL